ncbi:unnamed protein product [Rhizoctonia solani]|uniref:Uncharacterized protein n=1 Tax=Rhizoctonia solani TaxID=456999 RepID=A0A8H3DME9_9AGAM|nr:unnamed protein product [Rhizoctonia solani]
MLEEIAQELEEALANGINAYDCETHKEVTVIPWVYAMQGDNPMQSELSSHIGMTGKFFCQVCYVRGKDKDREGGQESVVERVKEFMEVHRLRHAAETIAELQKQESYALRGTFSLVDTEARKTGVKDKYLSSFLAVLKDQAETQLARSSKQSSVDLIRKLRENMPERLINPGLFIHELDANQDTPVEILHVILLGVAKYFWRDAVSRQSTAGKEELKARINSLDVSGLNLGPLRGTTLVQYAKSLTGRDFRAIIQTGPIILHGLLPPCVFEAWLALSHVAPLAFQQEIDDMDVYLPRLVSSINNLLQATVLWSAQWFNKPKFHVLLHLPEHIRRFGPATLFATETFESYNAVIRLRSIHSNRHAPSHDIARAFCRLYAIRFLVSGGWVTCSPLGQPESHNTTPITPRQAGSAILELRKDQIFMDLMEMSHYSYIGQQVPAKFTLVQSSSSTLWNDTASSRSESAPNLGNLSVRACEKILLQNHDTARLNGFGLIRYNNRLCPVQVVEILISTQPTQVVGMTVKLTPLAAESNNIYNMPEILLDSPTTKHVFIQEEVCAS